MSSNQSNSIALEGGGAKGAYQIGAWKAFMEEGISFEAASGASMGAINGAFIIQGDFEKALAFWNDLSAKRRALIDVKKARGFLLRLGTDLGLAFLPMPLGKLRVFKYARYFALLIKAFSDKGAMAFLLKEGLVNTPLLGEILFNHLDLERLIRSEMDLYIFAHEFGPANLPDSGGATFIRARDLDAETLKSHLMASIAFPLMFPSVSIGGKTYRDGDLILPDILSPLKDKLPDRIFVVHSRAWKSLMHKNHPKNPVIHIIPSRNIGTLYQKTFDFSSETLGKLMELGYQDAKKIMGVRKE